jgi:RecA-family ATPase
MLADFGWYVFPVKANKKPLAGFEWRKLSSCTPDEIDAMPWDEGEWVAVDCGKSGVCVVDVDQREAMQGQPLGGTMFQITQREGGMHLVYKAPPFHQGNTQAAPVEGIDIRGAGGYFIWYNNADLDDHIAPWPYKQEIRNKKLERPAPRVEAGHAFHSEYGPRTGPDVLERTRDMSLAQHLGLYRELGLHEAELLELAIGFNQMRCVPPLEHKELVKTARSIAGYPSDVAEKRIHDAQALEDLFVAPKITMAERLAARLSPRVIVPGWLYADIKTRNATGGVGKTTLALWEACRLAAGKSMYGASAEKPVRTVFVTKEDRREQAVARIHQLALAMQLTAEQDEQVNENVQVLDFSGSDFRLCTIVEGVVVINEVAIARLEKFIGDWGADWVIIDPVISFGVGEERKNDAAQGLVDAFKRICRKYDCCVEGISHVSKEVLRNKIDDALVGRGSSALGDGSRMVHNMMEVTAEEWFKSISKELPEDATGMVLSNPKNTYAQRNEQLFIQREGFKFTWHYGKPINPAEAENYDAATLRDWILKENHAGREPTLTQLKYSNGTHGVPRTRVERALDLLIDAGKVKNYGKKGVKGAGFRVIENQ